MGIFVAENLNLKESKLLAAGKYRTNFVYMLINDYKRITLPLLSDFSNILTKAAMT